MRVGLGMVVMHAGVAERLGSGLQSRVHGFESRHSLALGCGAVAGTPCVGTIDDEQYAGKELSFCVPVHRLQAVALVHCFVGPRTTEVGGIRPQETEEGSALSRWAWRSAGEGCAPLR